MIKMIRNFLYFLAASFLVLGTVSCSEKIDTGTDISGQWHLTDTGGLIEDQNMAIDVYISFDSGNFSLYQKVGEDLLRYWYYDGTYSVSGDNVLTGRYTDGTRLGGARGLGYSVSLSGDELTLTEVASGEVSVYRRAEIPLDVIDNAVPPVRSGDRPAPVL